jgi:hypothetical protein
VLLGRSAGWYIIAIFQLGNGESKDDSQEGEGKGDWGRGVKL